MPDFIREFQLRPNGPKLKVILKEGLLPDQTKPALYQVHYNPEQQTLTVTHAENVSTRYAAVNGIENDLDRAAIVMLDKVQAISHLRRDRDPIDFTLFHLPERGFAHDVALSAAENAGYTSPDVKALLGVLENVSKRDQEPVIWAVHSRGADVFNAAVREANRKGEKLKGQSVAVFGGAVHNPTMRDNLREAGVSVVGKGFYNHPLDVVPQVVGLNTVNPVKLFGSIISVPTLVTPYSPHTWHPALTQEDLIRVLNSQWEKPGVNLIDVPRVTPEEINALLSADPSAALKLASTIDARVNLAAEHALEIASAPVAVPGTRLQPLVLPVFPAPEGDTIGPGETEPARIFPAAKPSPNPGPRL